MEFISGVVIAVVIGAVLFADRLGGTSELARRLFQVALAFVLGLLVISAAALFIDPADPNEDDESNGVSNSEQIEEINDSRLARETIRVGGGVLLVLIGIYGLRTWRTIPLAAVAGGALAVSGGGSGSNSDPVSAYSSLISGYASYASDEMRLVNTLMLLAAAAVMVWFGYAWYERPPGMVATAEDATDDALA